MKISVLIPTYNRKTMVAEALRKIFSFQPRSYHEVIVSDNHSTDGTEKALFQEFGNQIIFTRPGKHVPAYENWRHAYLQATGTHVHFHWSDDWLERNFYHAAVERLQSSGDAIAATTARIVEEDGFDSIHYSQGFSRELGWETALRKLFFQEGDAKHWPYTFWQARNWAGSSPLSLLRNKANRHYRGLEHVPIRDFASSVSRLRDSYVHMSSNTAELEFFCLARWLVMGEFARREGLREFLCLDSDVLIHERPAGIIR